MYGPLAGNVNPGFYNYIWYIVVSSNVHLKFLLKEMEQHISCSSMTTTAKTMTVYVYNELNGICMEYLLDINITHCHFYDQNFFVPPKKVTNCWVLKFIQEMFSSYKSLTQNFCWDKLFSVHSVRPIGEIFMHNSMDEALADFKVSHNGRHRCPRVFINDFLHLLVKLCSFSGVQMFLMLLVFGKASI